MIKQDSLRHLFQMQFLGKILNQFAEIIFQNKIFKNFELKKTQENINNILYYVYKEEYKIEVQVA